MFTNLLCRSGKSSGRLRHFGLAFITASAFLLAACGSNGNSEEGGKLGSTTLETKPATTEVENRDPATSANNCPDVEAVATIVGGEVDQSSAFGFNVSASATLNFNDDDADNSADVTYSYEGCSYQLANLDNRGQVEVTWLSSEETNNQTLFELLAKRSEAAAKKNGFNYLGDLGDDAYQDGEGLAVLTTNAMLLFEYLDPNGEPAFDGANEMANAVVPIDLDGDSSNLNCDALSSNLPARLGSVESIRNHGGALFVDDVEINFWGCEFSFDNGAISKVNVASPAQWNEWVKAKKASPFTKSYQALAIGGHDAFDDGNELIIDLDGKPLRVTASGDDLHVTTAETRLAIAELVLKNR